MSSSFLRFFIGLAAGLALLLGYAYWAYTCGPGIDHEKYRISYVDPDLLSDSLYQSYYRSLLWHDQSYYAPYGDWYMETDGTQPKVDPNIAEWKAYLGDDVPATSIEDLIYRADRAVVEDVIARTEDEQSVSIPDRIITVDAWYRSEYPDLSHEELMAQIRAEERFWLLDTINPGPALRAAADRKDLPFLRYVLYAKDNEPWVTRPNPWEGTKEDLAAMNALIERGTKERDAATSEFLRLRYAYQIVRLAHYSGKNRQAIELYDKLVTPSRASSIVRGWALGHKAGAVKRTGDTALANYLFSLAFDSSESRRQIALLDFNVSSEKLWNATYAHARNDRERATLWMMRGLVEPRLSFEYLRRIVELDPSSTRTSAMLLRELGRIERYLYDDMETRDLNVRRSGTVATYRWDEERETTVEEQTNVLDDYRNPQRHIAPGRSWDTLVYTEQVGDEEPVTRVVEILSGRDYVLAFREFAKKTAREGKVVEPALWYVASAYIDVMDGDYDMAEACLNDADGTATTNYDLRHQIRLLDYLATVRSGKATGGMNPGAEVLTALQWFEKKSIENRNSKFNSAMASLGQRYLRENDVPHAILAFNRANDLSTRNVLLDIYSTDEDLAALQSLVESGGSTDFERMLLDSFSLGVADILDLRGTRMLRAGEFRAALTLLEGIPAEHWNGVSGPEPDEYKWMPRTHRTFYPRTFYSSTDTARFNGVDLVYEPSRSEGNTVTMEEIIRTSRAVEFNKLTFAREAAGLFEESERNREGRDSALLRLGNLLFNTPYWGYADVVWEGGMLFQLRYRYLAPTAFPFNIEGVAERMERAERTFLNSYGSRALAQKFYGRALKLTADDELAAHCAYMVDLCDKRPQTSLHKHPTADEQGRTGFGMLMAKYRDTRTAKRILSQCEIYKQFVAEGGKAPRGRGRGRR